MGASEPVAVVCSNENIQSSVCGFGEFNVTNNCNCTSSVIISEATLLAPQPGGNETLYCSNQIQEECVSVAVQGNIARETIFS